MAQQEANDAMKFSGVDQVLASLRRALGDDWGADNDENQRFCAECSAILEGLEGAHLVAAPDVENGRVVIRIWLDVPMTTLMEVDDLAYEAFGRISRDLFFVERLVQEKAVVYRFVTGTADSGTAGDLTLVGPHAADFAEYYEIRRSERRRFHA